MITEKLSSFHPDDLVKGNLYGILPKGGKTRRGVFIRMYIGEYQGSKKLMLGFYTKAQERRSFPYSSELKVMCLSDVP